MKLNKIAFALLAGLCLCACKEDEPVVPGPDPVEPDPVVPIELNNQYLIGDEPQSIGSVVKYEKEGQFVFALYEKEGVVDTTGATTPAIEVHIAPTLLAQELDLATATAEEVTITVEGVNTDAPTGTLQVTVDDTQEKVTIVLESENAEKLPLRAHYDGAFATQVTEEPLNNQFAINDEIKSIGSVVKYNYENWIVFALYEEEGITEVSTTAPIELFLAPSALNKPIDLSVALSAEEAFISMSQLVQPTGTLEVIWDEKQGVVSIQLDAQENDTHVKAHYNGPAATYVELNNEYLIDGNIEQIGRVVMVEEENRYHFYILDFESISTTEADIDIIIDASAMGQELDLATTEQASVSIHRITDYQLNEGTLLIKFGRNNETIDIVLNSKGPGENTVRANYSGSYGTFFWVKNPHFTVTTQEGVTTEYGEFTSILRKTEGGKTHFAFADNNSYTPADCTSAQAGVWFSLVPYQGEVDATQIASFTFIDYVNNKVYDDTNSKVASGTITTKKATTGEVYMAMDVTLSNGINISAEYYGKAIDVDDLTPMLPAKEYGFYWYNGDGVETASAVINSVTCKTNTKGLLEFTFGNTDPGANTSGTWPKLTISPEIINQGAIDCSNASLNAFSIRYNSFQMDAPSGNEYKDPYIHVPTNGTLEVSKDDAGNYSIALDMIDEYTMGPVPEGEKPNSEDIQGSHYRLVINYKGAVAEK